MANGMTRPGLLAFMPQQRAARMFTQMAQPPQAQVSPGRVSPLPYPVYESGSMRGKAMPPYMDLQQRAAAQAQAMPPRPMPLEQAAMRAAQIRGAFGGRRAPQAPAAGGMGRIPDAFRQPLTSPTGQGIAAAALTGLEYGGPSMTPTSLGQGLARMGAAGLKAYTDAATAQQAATMEQRKMDIDAAYKAADIGIKSAKIQRQGPFAGTSMTAQSFNTILKLSDKMDKGTATPEEQAMYSLAYGNLSRPKVETRETDEGTVTVKVPPINLSRFHTPEGVSPEPEIIGEKRANFTDAETNAASFADRMIEATGIFDDLTASGYDPTSLRDFAASNLPRGLQGWALSDQGQQYLAAKKNFITAQLRKESGAAISEAEFETEDIKYFPQPGDTPATVEQKRVSRMKAVEGMKGASGAAYDVIFGKGKGDDADLPSGSVFIRRVGGVSYYKAPNGKILAVD